jgi:hypothetical protein
MANTVIVPDLSLGHLHIVGWPDADLDQTGHDPRSTYVELFWLGILGPTSVWLLRYMARHLEDAQEMESLSGSGYSSDGGVWLEVEETALAIGLASGRHRGAVFTRTVERLVRFNMARTVNGHTLAVRRHIPPITTRQVERLPESLRAAHQSWEQELAAATPGPDQ